MQVRGAVLILILVLLAAIPVEASAHGANGDPVPQGEGPSSMRPLQMKLDSKWIGNAICYSPYRDGQNPDGASPSSAQLREDLQLMLPHWNLLRTYGSSGYVEPLLSIIREQHLPMQVMLGVWISPKDSTANQREIDESIRLANAFPGIVIAVCVGNVTRVSWSDHRLPEEVLIDSIRRVREAVAVPVSTADDFKYWNQEESRTVAAEIDFLTMHAHPLWNGIQLEDALPWLERQVEAVQAMHPESVIVLGETGWATDHSREGEQGQLIKGQTGAAEQKQFYEAERDWAKAKSIPSFIFEAFDENWKGGDDPKEVEKHWGLFRADRTPKSEF